jgi:phosphatidylethanolamine/phosphatidyl-N-methylethanolamine N-methyltransferase
MPEGFSAAADSINAGSLSSRHAAPRAPLDAHAVRTAYRRWAKIYDAGFGWISRTARREVVVAVNRTEGTRVLEVGVGTGLALPLYDSAKRVTGIDLSADMLAQARQRATRHGLQNIEALLEIDAQATGFPDASFDIAVGMFVASVVPNPRALVKELQRVVRPGGKIFFVNHFAVERGPVWWVERAMAPSSALLGWHPDFHLAHMFTGPQLASMTIKSMHPVGLFRLIEMGN